MKLSKYLVVGAFFLSPLTALPIYSAKVNADTTVDTKLLNKFDNDSRVEEPAYNMAMSTTYESSDGEKLADPINVIVEPGNKLLFGSVLNFSGYKLNLVKSTVNFDGLNESLEYFVNELNMTPEQIVDYINAQTWNGSEEVPEQYIHYVYDKVVVPGGNIIVKYQDENGNSIANDVTLTGNVDDPYSSDQLNIDGYTFKEVNGAPSGTFDESTKTIVYIYTKNAIVQPGNPNPTMPDTNTNGGVINPGNSITKQPTTDALSESTTTNQATLPATGTDKTSVILIIGIIMAGLGTVGAFIFGRNK